MGAVGGLKLVQVPVFVEPDAVQFELAPVRAKSLSCPSLPFPLASTSVVTELLLASTNPWLKR